MARTILHVDLNNFYASVECLYRPEIRDKPVIVCGDIEARHGIVLAKNDIAKRAGVKTGDAIWEAKQKIADLVAVPADFKKYLRFSQMAKAIYADYTDQIEPFGIDECWLDVTGSVWRLGAGEQIANEIRQRIRSELGVTASVGVSWNKIFAKLGSDMKKPDATTIIIEENFRDRVWPLPVDELLYVGRSTAKKLRSRGVYTIGDLANRDLHSLKLLLGVWGETLFCFAKGLALAPVKKAGEERVIKSIGNSTTTHRDLVNNEDVKMIICVLAESVSARLRAHGLKCTTVSIYVRDNDLASFERQGKLQQPTFVSGDIVDKAYELFYSSYRWDRPIRSLGVRGSDLVTATGHLQLDLFGEDPVVQETVEKTIDDIRRRFGQYSIQRCSMLQDRLLTGFNPKDDHVIHPTSFFR
ncbi:MAG: DNA polymerase IV [Sporomusaceae bacterium]|nr:DNA polymerase IV [Sporomusaceae bacterium]